MVAIIIRNMPHVGWSTATDRKHTHLRGIRLTCRTIETQNYSVRLASVVKEGDGLKGIIERRAEVEEESGRSE